MLLGAAFDQSQVYVGPVIYTGGADRHGNTKGLSDGRLAELARLAGQGQGLPSSRDEVEAARCLARGFPPRPLADSVPYSVICISNV